MKVIPFALLIVFFLNVVLVVCCQLLPAPTPVQLIALIAAEKEDASVNRLVVELGNRFAEMLSYHILAVQIITAALIANSVLLLLVAVYLQPSQGTDNPDFK